MPLVAPMLGFRDLMGAESAPLRLESNLSEPARNRDKAFILYVFVLYGFYIRLGVLFFTVDRDMSFIFLRSGNILPFTVIHGNGQ